MEATQFNTTATDAISTKYTYDFVMIILICTIMNYDSSNPDPARIEYSSFCLSTFLEL